MTQREDHTSSFLSGLIVGLLVSAPVAAWLSPRSGRDLRADIRQRGVIIRRRTEDAIRKPLQAVQSQIEDLRGESVAESLAAGKALARQRVEPDKS